MIIAADIYSKYGYVIPLKDKFIIITNAFQKISEEFKSKGCKPNKGR